MDNELKQKYNILEEFIKEQPKPLVLAIEGKCASGKSTIANMFSDKYAIIHIDDFFLPMNKKTASRMGEVGGNINYELIYDLLIGIKNNKVISYPKFDCQKQGYSKVNIPYNEVIILEGVYSFHPYFNKLIDKLVYLEIDDKTQTSRINKRPNANRFFNEWIPLENKYYKESDILNKIDLKL